MPKYPDEGHRDRRSTRLECTEACLPSELLGGLGVDVYDVGDDGSFKESFSRNFKIIDFGAGYSAGARLE